MVHTLFWFTRCRYWCRYHVLAISCWNDLYYYLDNLFHYLFDIEWMWKKGCYKNSFQPSLSYLYNTWYHFIVPRCNGCWCLGIWWCWKDMLLAKVNRMIKKNSYKWITTKWFVINFFCSKKFFIFKKIKTIHIRFFLLFFKTN